MDTGRDSVEVMSHIQHKTDNRQLRRKVIVQAAKEMGKKAAILVMTGRCEHPKCGLARQGAGYVGRSGHSWNSS